MANRAKLKGRLESGSFVIFPHALLESQNFLALSAHAKALLFDLSAQYRGNNNGDLCATWSMMEKRGWKSRQTLGKAIKELEHFGLVERTRQGGRNAPNLHALTWHPVNECKGKLDARKRSDTASGLWKLPAENLPIAGRKLKRVARPAGQLDTTGGQP